jgi:hypothetical protein
MTNAFVEQNSGSVFFKTRMKNASSSDAGSIIVDGKSALLATFNFMEKYFQATRDYGVLTNDPA